MIYFDHAATTPIKPIALWAIENTPYGNPNSLHKLGLEAKAALAEAEDLVKRHLNGYNGKVVWLSTASLANALVIQSVLRDSHSLNAFICMKTAHKSILNLSHTETVLSPLGSGLVSIRELSEKVTNATKLVSILYVNNETGVIQPVEIIKPKIKKALYHVDAVQAAGKLPIDVEEIQCDFLTMSGHKFGAPKGIACLWIRNDTKIDLPYLGTPPVPMASAFAKTLISHNILQRKVDIELKEKFFRNCLAEHAKILRIDYEYNIKTIKRLPGLLSIRFKGIDASELLMNLSDKGLAVSSGSACNSMDIIPSHVLSAMGIPTEDILSTIRISLAPENTRKKLEEGALILTSTVKDMYHD